uniref:CCHC-type domain-containing protein n=1 Tax=Astyanax mexicanus TaxID=7994 RepID=A0A8B9HW21_ASTMX
FSKWLSEAVRRALDLLDIFDADVEQYLKRFCEILRPAHKLVDQFGLWYGVRRYKVKLEKDREGNAVHIPNSISVGPYNGRISYQGQLQRCFICSSKEHQVKDCNAVRCWKCGELGHKGKECTNEELCNLCSQRSHSYFKCPQSYSSRAQVSGAKLNTDITEGVWLGNDVHPTIDFNLKKEIQIVGPFYLG